MKRILLIGTGGTIASELTESGLTPELSTEQLLSHIPSIPEFCRADCRQILNLDSTNIAPQHCFVWPAASGSIMTTMTASS